MRRARAGISCNRRNRVAIELNRETRRQVVRDENRVGAFWDIHRIVIGQAEQND